MTNPPELRFFNTGEVAIHYAHWAAEPGNSQPALVFIHGITDFHQTWRWVVDDIRRGAEAIAVDLRGHNRSGRVPGPYRFESYPEDVIGLIEHLGVGPSIIIGHSLGALTAIQIAANRPDLVEAIVLEDPPLYGGPIMEAYPERRARFDQNAAISGSGRSLQGIASVIRANTPGADERLVQESALALFRTDARVISDAMEQMSEASMDWTAEIENRMRSVHCPTLLMQGDFERGGWLREEDSQRALELFPNCTLETWNDLGHSLHINESDRFTEQVNSFVDTLPATDKTS